MQGALNLFQARSTTAAGGVDTDYIQGVAMQLYCLNGSSKLFLSDVEASSYVDPLGIGTRLNYVYWDPDSEVGDYHTVAFLNGETDFDSKPVKMEIRNPQTKTKLASTKPGIFGTGVKAGSSKHKSDKTFLRLLPLIYYAGETKVMQDFQVQTQ